MKIIVITGQTATGKTKLALEMAQKYNGELINCDSRQIYKHLNIITGKDIEGKFSLVQKQGNFDIGYYRYQSKINQWLNDIVYPHQYFSSFDFKNCAQPLIERIINQGKTPIIVGGTYFYLYHLLYQVVTETIPPDWQLRKDLSHKTVPELQKILSLLSLQCFETLKWSDKNNPQRLIRKIEIIKSNKYQSQEKSLPFKLKDFYKNSGYDFIGIKFGKKDDLIKSVKTRIKQRLSRGAIDEVRMVLKKGYKLTDPGLKTIGYQQMIKYLNGELTKKQVVERWTNKEIQYAKRQVTFMKKDPNIKWIIR